MTKTEEGSDIEVLFDYIDQLCEEERNVGYEMVYASRTYPKGECCACQVKDGHFGVGILFCRQSKTMKTYWRPVMICNECYQDKEIVDKMALGLVPGDAPPPVVLH